MHVSILWSFVKDFEISNLDFVKEPNQAPISGVCDWLTIISSLSQPITTKHLFVTVACVFPRLMKLF